MCWLEFKDKSFTNFEQIVPPNILKLVIIGFNFFLLFYHVDVSIQV